MKNYYCYVMLVMLIVALVISNPVQADEFSETLETFKKSEAAIGGQKFSFEAK